MSSHYLAMCVTGQLPFVCLTILCPTLLGLPQNAPLPHWTWIHAKYTINPTGKLKQSLCLLYLHSSSSWAACHPRGLVITLTSNLEVFLSRCLSNQRSAGIPPSPVWLLECMKYGRILLDVTCRFLKSSWRAQRWLPAVAILTVPDSA